LNEWNGDLTIDKYGNYVMAAMLGAGSKDRENKFSGVVMGERKILEENSVKTDIGLFGFAAGTQTFEFNVNGTAKLGASGKG